VLEAPLDVGERRWRTLVEREALDVVVVRLLQRVADLLRLHRGVSVAELGLEALQGGDGFGRRGRLFERPA
jgi:hypothetical protein